ncbi:MAG: RnfABCDGE type electron transport complex subunit G [Bacteroidales bacterium]|nr:RnfABCDGE type electron transport complex subunit G [Bacteroidales bacterium]
MAVQSSFKNMSLCLLVICLVCSALLAGVYALTKEPIDAAAKAKNEAAIKEVLPEVAVTIEEERTVDFEGSSYTYNLAYDELGNTVGCAINVAPSGFGGPIAIKVGFDINGVIWNTKVLSQAETPGLGAKCVEPAFSDQFKGFDPAQKKLAVKKDGGDVDAITASTITSRAYAEGLALAVKVFQALAQTPMPLEADVEDSAEVSGTDPVIPSEVEVIDKVAEANAKESIK